MRLWLKQLRLNKGLTVNETAVMSEISRSYYEKIELGKRNVPVLTAKKIALVLGFDWQKFFEEVK